MWRRAACASPQGPVLKDVRRSELSRHLHFQNTTTKRLLCIPVQGTYQCKTRGEERSHCPPSDEADVDNAPSMSWQDALPYAFEAVLESNLLVTLPHGKQGDGRWRIEWRQRLQEVRRNSKTRNPLCAYNMAQRLHWGAYTKNDNAAPLVAT